MRIVSWNLQHGVPDPGRSARPSRGPCPRCEALAADVYAFQELDRGRVRTRFAHQARVLGRGARTASWCGPGPSTGCWASQGNALVVRGEVLDVRGRRRCRADGERRGGGRGGGRDGGPALVGGDHPPVARAGGGPPPAAGDARRAGRAAQAVGAGRRPQPAARRRSRAWPRRRATTSLDGPFTDQRAHAAEPPPRPRPASTARPPRRAASAKLPCSDHLAVWADLRVSVGTATCRSAAPLA